MTIRRDRRTNLAAGILLGVAGLVSMVGVGWFLAFFAFPFFSAITAPTVVFVFPNGFRGPFHVIEDARGERTEGSDRYTIRIPSSGTVLVPSDSVLRDAHDLRATYDDKSAIETDARDSSSIAVRAVYNWYADDRRFVMTYVVGTRSDEDRVRRQHFSIVNAVVVARPLAQ